MCERAVSRREFASGALSAAFVAGVPSAFRLPTWNELQGEERPHLEVALEAWRWIESSRIVAERGVTWPADPADPASTGTTLYTHGAGVLPFALELYYATQDGRFLAEAMAGADHLASVVGDVRDAGLYTGLAGLAFVFEETYRATAMARFRHYAQSATDILVRDAERVGAGLAWPATVGGETRESNDVISGTAGTGLGLLYLHGTTRNPRALEAAVAAGRRLVERAETVDAGRRWSMWPGYPREMPNFSHGTAGVSYFLARLFQASEDWEFLDAAVAGARYLQSIAVRDGDGYLIPHHAPGGEDLFYLSWCHGPVGTNRLFHALWQATGDEEWLEWMHRGARGIMATGIPERRTPGFWDNVSQCGGSAGVGEFFLAFHRITGAAAYRTFVDRLTDDLLRRSTEEDGGRRWVQAEHRVQPELLVAQTGFMQGAAGVGKYFLHLDAMERGGAGPVVLLPDAPY